MEDRKFLIISLVVAFVLMLGAVLFLSKESSSTKIIDTAVLTGDGKNFKGKEGAGVTIVEFSDFQCPACRMVQPEVAKVYEAYKDKVRIVYRHYPLTTIHKYAQRAAESSEFASENGKFWEFHDALFAKQEEWSASSDEKKLYEYLAGYARALGLDDKKLLESLNNKTNASRVQRDVEDGNKAGINATPTFFVNGEKMDGFGFEEFKRLIEKNLK